MLLDDLDRVGVPPGELRRLADDGAFVAVTLPRHLVVDDSLTGDLDPEWAGQADLTVEVRTSGITGTTFTPGPGDGVLRLLQHRHGPVYDVHVRDERGRGRFTDL